MNGVVGEMEILNRKSHWDKAHSERKPAEASWFQAEPTLSLRLIQATGLPREAPIIDVGAGASFLVDRLIQEGRTRLAVLDVSGIALDHVRRRLGGQAALIEFLEADVTEFDSPHEFQLWHDRAVFHFLTDADDRRRYVETLKRTVPPGGHLILAAFAVGGPTRCSGLDVVQYDSEKLLGKLGGGFELIEEAAEDHGTPAGGIQKFAFFRLRNSTTNSRPHSTDQIHKHPHGLKD